MWIGNTISASNIGYQSDIQHTWWKIVTRKDYMQLTAQDVEKLRTFRLHFCVPCYGGQITESFFISMLKFMNVANQVGMSYTVDTMVNESLITRGRNSLVAKFLCFEPRSTHLMFIDADIGFEPQEIIKLALSNQDVVGGLYPKKALPIQYVVNKVPNGEKNGNVVEVANLGTGFLMIRREVIETMIASHPELHYQDEIGLDPKYAPYKYALFDGLIDPVTREYLSEDYTFCKRWRDLGGKIFADLSIKLDHAGFYKFAGDATQLAPHL
jgi:hypothetical protein